MKSLADSARFHQIVLENSKLLLTLALIFGVAVQPKPTLTNHGSGKVLGEKSGMWFFESGLSLREIDINL